MWLPKVGTGERVMRCCYCQITIVRGTPDASLYRENERLLSRGVCSLVVRCRNNKVSGCGLVQKTKAPRSLRTAGVEGEGRRLPVGGDISADTMGEGLGSPNVPSAETWRQETDSGVRPSRHITSWGAEGEPGG